MQKVGTLLVQQMQHCAKCLSFLREFLCISTDFTLGHRFFVQLLIRYSVSHWFRVHQNFLHLKHKGKKKMKRNKVHWTRRWTSLQWSWSCKSQHALHWDMQIKNYCVIVHELRWPSLMLMSVSIKRMERMELERKESEYKRIKNYDFQILHINIPGQSHCDFPDEWHTFASSISFNSTSIHRTLSLSLSLSQLCLSFLSEQASTGLILPPAETQGISLSPW